MKFHNDEANCIEPELGFRDGEADPNHTQGTPPPSSRRACNSPAVGRKGGRTLLALTLLVALALPGGGVMAQTRALVSNDRDTYLNFGGLAQWDFAQGFTTGANSSGYTLTSVEFRQVSTTMPISVSINANANGSPGNVLGTLTGPAISGDRTYTHAGIHLAANTTYFVVMGGGGGTIHATLSNSQTGLAGWSIADKILYRNRGSRGNWLADIHAVRIRINGTVNTADETAPNKDPAVVSSKSSVTVNEAPGKRKDYYTVNLATEPTGNVKVTPTSSNRSNAIVRPSSLTFTPENWSTPQTVTVKAVDDDYIDPTRSAKITHKARGGGYDSTTPTPTVSVTVTNDDASDFPSVITFANYSPTSQRRLTVHEGGNSLYRIRLSRGPLSDVTVTVSSADASVATAEPTRSTSALTFTRSNWKTIQEVVVYGVDNTVVDPEVAGWSGYNHGRTTHLTHSVSGGGYGDVSVPNSPVFVRDDDGRTVTIRGPQDRNRVPRNVALSSSGLVTWDLDTETEADSRTKYLVEWEVKDKPPSRMTRWAEDIEVRESGECENGVCEAQIEDFDAERFYLIHVNTLVRWIDGYPPAAILKHIPGSDTRYASIATDVGPAGSIAEGETLSFTVTLATAAPVGGLDIALTVADATGSDFLEEENEGETTLAFEAGATSKTWSVETTDDDADEPDGDVTVTVGAGDGYTVGSPLSASVTVRDNDGDGGDNNDGGGQGNPGGGATAPSPPTPPTPPLSPPSSTISNAPENLRALAGNSQVTLSWDAPGDDGGATITGYQYRLKESEGALGIYMTIPESGSGEANEGSYTVTGLKNEREYVFHVRARNAQGGGLPAEVTVTLPSVVHAESEELPTEVALLGNYPNPFNPETRIAYALPSAVHVRLAVYDVQGREVRILENGLRPAGRHTAVFDAVNLPAGIYVYRLQTAEGVFAKIMTLVK